MLNKGVAFLAEEFPSANAREISHAVSSSLLSTGRIKSIGKCLKEVSELEGDTAEVGAFEGGTSKIIALLNNGQRHWVCDTFSGLLDAGRNDRGLTNGMFSAKFETAQENLKDLPNVNLVRGYFPESAPSEMRSARYTFVHIDVDTYDSIHNCFEFFIVRMAEGGLIALDDVLLLKSGCLGAQKAWREIRRHNSRGWEIFSEEPPQVVVRVGGR